MLSRPRPGAERAEAPLAGEYLWYAWNAENACPKPSSGARTGHHFRPWQKMSSRDKGGENCPMRDERCASRKGETDKTPTFVVGCDGDASCMHHQRDATDDGRCREDNSQAIQP